MKRQEKEEKKEAAAGEAVQHRVRPLRVLFVCMGNICRSPAAEGIFRALVTRAGLETKISVDSAGTGGWHVGEPPDSRMIFHAHQRGYDLRALRARQFEAPDDFLNFDHILTMDDDNLQTVLALDVKNSFRHKVKPLVSYCRVHEAEKVPDPYYRGEDGFEHVLDLLEDACDELLTHLQKDK